MKRTVLGLVFVGLATLTAACGGASGASPAADASAPAASAPAGDETVVVAKDLAFTPTALTVAADAPVEIVLDNQESAPHNIAVKDASGAEVFKGEIVTNAKVTNSIPALAAGTYTFWCEVHPDMQGTITAE